MENKYNSKDSISKRIKQFESTVEEWEKIDMIFDSTDKSMKIQYVRVTGVVNSTHIKRLLEFGICIRGFFGSSSNTCIIGFMNIEDEI